MKFEEKYGKWTLLIIKGHNSVKNRPSITKFKIGQA
jgi:hypothetical protein